jgi:hypothetical protein
LFEQSDINATQTTAALDPMLFGLVDNVTVTAVPEPSTCALFGVAGLAFATRRKLRSGLQSSLPGSSKLK